MNLQSVNPPAFSVITIGLVLILTIISPYSQAESLQADWPLYGREHNNQRYSPLSQINENNVNELTLSWRFNTGKIGSFQSSPLIVKGVMYITTPYNDVLALKADSGELIWRYEHELRSTNYCCGPANRGAAFANGKVYTVTIDSRLIALDQHTGQMIWDRTIIDTDAGTGEILEPLLGVAELQGATQTGQSGYSANLAPQVFGNKILVGITGAGYGLHLNIEENEEQVLSVGGLSGGGHGLRGFLVAYDLESGNEIWRWYSVPEKGWQGSWSKKTEYGVDLNRRIEAEKLTYEQYKDTWRYGGGSIYTTPAIDAKLGLVYIGTGNPSPQMDDSTRPGDNLYTVSLVALEIETGKLRWHYQQVPHDRWGYDVASPPVLFDLESDEKIIPVVGQASKLGWFFIHDRLTGELIRKSAAFIPQDNLFARPTAKGVRIVPGTLGAASWSPVAYHPGLNQVYIPAIYQPSMFFSRKLKPEPGKPWASYTFFKKSDEADWGLLSAVNTETGKLSWQIKVDDPMVGGAITTAGNLIFTGQGDGSFKAYRANDGKELWHFKSEFGVNAPPVTFMLDGKQYVAVAAGGNKLFGYKTGDEILVFSLP